jgi:Family of unknown function (DUF5706)
MSSGQHSRAAERPSEPTAESERLAKDLLDRTRAETSQAENKAAILLAGILAGAGGLAATDGAKLISVYRPWYTTVLLWATAAAVLAAIVCLAAAIYPRSRTRHHDQLSAVGYFGDVMALGSPLQLRSQLSGPGERVLDVWVDQVWQTSALVSRKYGFVRWAIRLLALALTLAVVTVILAIR